MGGLTMNIHSKGARMPELSETTGSGVKQYGKLERGLNSGKEACIALEKLYRDSYAGGHITGTECMKRIAQVGVWRGQLAALEAEVYQAHAADTAEAKRLGVDSGGPYAVLARIAPPSTRSGGDR